ncbi:DUF397 domain-containing protein [Streptomyces sp. NPDC048361]|uniref:DUF397 domain-containing protein n=1 Tax=Streptomyces sp. NPDC048361 TaxID=3154720 RepID=UPI003447D808
MSNTLQWFKSSYSDSGGGQCLELAVTWHKSSYSNARGGACVEVATCPQAVHIRDSKVPHGATLAVAPGVWAAFLDWEGAPTR